MEAKYLASILSFLSIFLAIYVDAAVNNNNNDEDSTEFELETAIYYGDSNVNIGEPFSITCIIPITDPIFWIKDDEPITRHNLRHGRDEHSYMLSESAIEGEKHKIEAHISVRHALKVHEGKYQCNNLHTSSYMLYVRSPDGVTNSQTKTPFTLTSNNNNNQIPTDDSVYETIYDLTPSAQDDYIFTRTWEPVPPALPPLPTHTTVTAASAGGVTTTQQQQRQHHQHHHRQQQQQQQQKELNEQHKFIYVNDTNLDGNLHSLVSTSSSSGGAGGGGDLSSEENIGIINLEYNNAPARKQNASMIAWRPHQTNMGRDEKMNYPKYSMSATPPQFPPPRTAMPSTTLTPPTTSLQYYTPMFYTPPDNYYQTVTANTAPGRSISSSTGTHYHQQQPPPHFSNFPQQTVLQQQPIYPYGQSPAGGGGGAATPMPTNTYYVGTYAPAPPYPPYYAQPQTPQIPFQQYNQVPTQQQQQPPPTMGTTLTSTILQPVRKEPDFLVPNYDNVQQKLKVYEIRSPLALSCNVTKEGNYELKWEKDGVEVSKVKSLAGRYRIIAAERRFVIDKTDIHDDGKYSCVVGEEKADIDVVARVIVRVPSNVNVVEGEKLTIICTVVGTNPQLSWAIGNLTLQNTTDRYVLKADENKVQNAILTVENISLNDRGEYKCLGRNSANDYADYPEASDVTYIRIKGKLAALWPFLGILAEVAILCAIICIYERRRNKSELEESDTDPQDH